MIILDKRKYERIVYELIDAKDIRELAEKFSLDRVYYYHILKDISAGQRSPNYKRLKSIAARRKLSEDFVIEQAKSVLNFFIPYYQGFQPESLDYYKVLNVPRNASDEEIRRSWIELMKSHHPDRAGAEGLDTSKKINEAYEVLSNSAKREAYDNKHLPPTPVIVPQNEMRKYYYAASLMVVVFLAVMYASGSGLIFESTEEKQRLAREIEAPELPNTVYKGDLVDTEKVDKRISEIKPIEPRKPAGDTNKAAAAGKDVKSSETPEVEQAVVPEKPAENSQVVVEKAQETKTEKAEAGPEDKAPVLSKTDNTDNTESAPEDGVEDVSADNAGKTEPVEKADNSIEITEVTVDKKEEKAASDEAENEKEKLQAETGNEASGPEIKDEVKDKKEQPEPVKVAGASPEDSAPDEKAETAPGKDSPADTSGVKSADAEKETAPEAGLAKTTEADAEKKGEVTEITMPDPEKKPDAGEYYTVRKGDSLWSIAHKFDTSTAELSRLNGLGNNKIDVGDKLLISGEGVPVVKPKPEIAALEKKREKAEPAPAAPAVKVKLPEPLITEVAKPAKQPVKSDITEDFDPKIATSAVAIRETERIAPEPIPAATPPDRNSVYVFVSDYVAAYKNRDINRVKALFAPDAVENGVGIARVLSTYSSNFSKLDIVSYEVKVNRVSLQNTLGFVRGDFFITFKDQRTGVLKNSRGNINWRLSWSEGVWKIQELTYRIEYTDTVGG